MISSSCNGFLVVMSQDVSCCVCINIFITESAIFSNNLDICNCYWLPQDKLSILEGRYHNTTSLVFWNNPTFTFVSPHIIGEDILFEYCLILTKTNDWDFYQLHTNAQSTSKTFFLSTFVYNILKLW